MYIKKLFLIHLFQRRPYLPPLKMSWSEYVTGTSGLMAHYDKIACAGIFGHNGSTWAQKGMDHTTQYYNEITAIMELFTNPKEAYSTVLVLVFHFIHK